MRPPGDRGSITAELAVAMPVLVMLMTAAMTGVGAVVTQLRCVDAAREIALAQSRGDHGDEAGRRAAPASAEITISVDGDVVQVIVRAPVRPFGPRLPGLTVSGHAVAAREPEV